MAGKFSKRKNPVAVDCWLESLGYYRKNVAYDETCLFRAVSEQLFCTQIYHEDIRKNSIEYGMNYPKVFKHLMIKRRDWYDHLKKLCKHMMVCTDVELNLICFAYKADITVFNAKDHKIQEFQCNHVSPKIIRLCKIGDHFDAVYTTEHILDAGFCQSIVYNVLYENVFKIANVSSIVNVMLHDKQPPCPMYYADKGTSKEDVSEDEESLNNINHVNPCSSSILAPFPYKVAKALDPNMYRNIEYDTWLEIRREFRLGEWYYGDDKLIQGTRCVINLNGEDFHCYIQEFLRDDLCTVYITRLAERLIVKYTELKREEDAKPWPLPYRFARNVTPLPLTNVVSSDKDVEHKSLRKRREKKRSQMANENKTQSDSKDIVSHDIKLNIKNYAGCSLMKTFNQKDVNDTPPAISLPTVSQVHSGNNSDLNNNNSNNCLPESSNIQWSELTNCPESVSWVQDSTSSEEIYSPFGERMITSRPTSAPYQDSNGNGNGQMFYNYGEEFSWPTAPTVWSNSQYVAPPDARLPTSEGDPDVNAQKYIYYRSDSAYGSSTYLPYGSPMLPSPQPSSAFITIIGDRTVCSAPVTPNSPHINMVPLVYPVQPSTTPTCSAPATPISPHVNMVPLIYPVQPPTTPIFVNSPQSIPTPTPRPPDYFIPTGVPVELQYVNPPTYMYPPQTPPVAWY